MQYEEFIRNMDDINAEMTATGITIESFEHAIDRAEAALGDVMGDDPEGIWAHFVRASREGKPSLKPESRLNAAQRYYRANREALRGAVYHAYPNALPFDVDRITVKLSEHLPSYRGPKTHDEFLAWAVRFVHREADLLSRFTILYTGARKRLIACLWHALVKALDLGKDDETIPALESEVWAWVLNDPKSPLYEAVGTASPSTRICEYAKGRVRGWQTKQFRDRAKFTSTSSDEGMAQADAAANPLAVGARKPAAE